LRPFRSFSPLIVAAGLGLAQAACAMDIATYDAQRKAAANSQVQVRLRIYLLGVGEGLKLANAQLVRRNVEPMFCLPEAKPLFAEDYIQAIDSTMRQDRRSLESEQVPIEVILLMALGRAYPCASVGGPSAEPVPAGAPASAPAATVAPAAGAEAAAAAVPASAASAPAGAAAEGPDTPSPVTAPASAASAPTAPASAASAPPRP
jgi:hypothetical protein